MTKDKNITTLIIVPNQDQLGGVYNFYKNLKPHLEVDFKYFYVGEPIFFLKNKVLVFVIYLFNFIWEVFKQKPQKIILNTSLNINAVLRDSVYLFFAKLLRKEVIVFWRGWNFDNERYLKFPYSIITCLLLKSDKSIVLSSKIEKSLIQLGYKKSVFRVTTMVGDLAYKYHINPSYQEPFNLIFLSRVETYKGIYELLSAFVILKKKYSNLQLTIIGSGSQLNNIIKKNDELALKDVHFHGYVKGESKYELLIKGSLFIFPSYSEGMPNAVLEAMAIGFPIITTPVGGLRDFFVENKMGKFIKIKDVESIVNAVEDLYLDSNLRKLISSQNKDYALNNFRGEIVFDRLKSIIDK